MTAPHQSDSKGDTLCNKFLPSVDRVSYPTSIKCCECDCICGIENLVIFVACGVKTNGISLRSLRKS